MSTTTRRIGAAAVVGLLALAAAAACGGSQTPTSTPTTPTVPSTTATPSPTPSPTPEPGLTGPTVVVVRALSDDSRVLVAYDLEDGTTRELATLANDCHPAVDAAGTSVVVAHITTPDSASCIRGAYLDTRGTSHLVFIDLITGERGALTEPQEGRMDLHPQWNRAGDGWVYFQRTDVVAHTAGLWRAHPSTGKVEEVLEIAQVAWGGFALEPGGGSIRFGAPTTFTRLDLATGTMSHHDNENSGRIGDVAWTPDGAWFASTRREGEFPPSPAVLIMRWPDGAPRTLLTLPPDEGATTRWHQLGQVGWHPDGSVVVLQDLWASQDTAEPSRYQVPEQRILLVDTANGSAFPIGPDSVRDLSFDIWTPPPSS